MTINDKKDHKQFEMKYNEISLRNPFFHYLQFTYQHNIQGKSDT